MTLDELEELEMSEGLAYALGLIYPLSKYGKNDEDEKFIIGSVNHNEVEPEELAAHFSSTLNLMKTYNLSNLSIKNNQSKECPKVLGKNGYRTNSKKGFSVFIFTENLNTKKIEEILTKKVEEIKESSQSIKKNFAKGCFDGRSSWDTTYHLLALDVDRNYKKQDLIISIFDDIGIELNKNRREQAHPKNDQLRVKKNCIHDYYDRIGFDSLARKKIIEKAIENLCL